MKKFHFRKVFIALTVALGILIATIAWVFRSENLHVTSGEYWLLIKKPSSAYSLTELKGVTIKHPLIWKLACMTKRLETIKPGRYKLTDGMSNSDIIGEFRSGGHPTITMRIDDAASLQELAAKMGMNLLNDSAYFMNSFTDDTLLQALGINQNEVAALIRPDTYEFFWNMGGKAFLSKMKSQSELLWNVERKNKAAALQLSPFEIIVLASIVKAETGSLEEAPIIAGLYLNRLRIDMPLQSDPTVLFGRKKAVQRVYLSDLQAQSPYNTYLHKGLPPGPINFPETVYIDAVLNSTNHTYIYMCAEPGGTGRHYFAESLALHEANRQRYIQWLEKKDIR